MTIGMIFLICGFPPFTFILLKKNHERLQQEDFKGRFESLYLNVDTRIN